MIPGGKPVTDEEPFGLIPTSPFIVVAPVLVMAWSASTAKFVAVPSLGWVAARTEIGQSAAIASVSALEISKERRRILMARHCKRIWASRQDGALRNCRRHKLRTTRHCLWAEGPHRWPTTGSNRRGFVGDEPQVKAASALDIARKEAKVVITLSIHSQGEVFPCPTISR